MAIKKISEFVSATPTSEDKILFEHNGAGKSATFSDVGRAMGVPTKTSQLTNDSGFITGSYLPLSGGAMSGSIHFSPDSLPQKSLSYVCGIDSFADGGEMGWQSRDEFLTYKSINGTLTATAVQGAVFNDLADAIPVGEGDVLEAGYCYGFDGEHYTKTSGYMQKSYIGIHSDTYGFKMGHEEGKEKLNVAISGFVLAYVDKEYEVGTPLTCTSDGHLTEIKLEDKIKYPERVVATYWKNEPNEKWGPEGDKIKVKGRKWVKVK